MAKGEFISANFAESWATRGGAARLYDEPMTLSSTQKAAWAAVLSSVRGGRTLPPALQAALVDFFADPPSVRCECGEGRGARVHASRARTSHTPP